MAQYPYFMFFLEKEGRSDGHVGQKKRKAKEKVLACIWVLRAGMEERPRSL
jgi:hypothetical protein